MPETLLRFFREFDPVNSAKLQFVCSDMWAPYLKAIAKKATPRPASPFDYVIIFHPTYLLGPFQNGEKNSQ